MNHSGASYVVKIGGVEDTDGTVSLEAGSNVITVEVTAEDGTTKKTYTVTVTRLVTSQQTQASTDATLSGLTLSGIDFGTFASATETYTASVANSVSETTVTPTLNDSNASYLIKLGGTEDTDGTVSLAVGINVITVEVTAEDETTEKTYTVTVTRAAASTDATLSGLTLSGVDFGTFASGTESYTAEVTNNPTETTVTPTVNHSGACYVVKIGGVEDADGTVSLEAGSNVITVEVTAEDGTTKKTYTVTVTRLVTSQQTQASTDATLSGLTLSGVDFGTFASGTESYTASVAYSISETTVTPTLNDSDASYVIKLGGTEDSDGTVSLAVGSNVITVEVTAEDDSTEKTYTVTVTRAAPPSTDATLSGLTLSGVDFGTFAAATTSYTASVANSVSETSVTPTVNDSGASYVINLGGVTDADGTVALAVGENVITVEVTAEDGETQQTYTLTVTRAPALLVGDLATDDPPVNFRVSSYDSDEVALTWEIPRNRGITEYELVRNDHNGTEFAQSDWSASASAAGGDSVAESSTGLTADSRYRYDLSLKSGDGTVIIEKSLEVRTLASDAAALSTDSTLSTLSLSGVTLDSDFSSSVYRYNSSVDNDITQTTVTATPSDTAASHAVKLGGVVDEDGSVDLSPGRNLITVRVTAENGVTASVYTVVVSRGKLAGTLSSDASLRSLSLIGLDIGAFDTETSSYTAQATHDVSQAV